MAQIIATAMRGVRSSSSRVRPAGRPAAGGGGRRAVEEDEDPDAGEVQRAPRAT